MKSHFLAFFFFPFLFNFLSFPFSNFGFLILMSWPFFVKITLSASVFFPPWKPKPCPWKNFEKLPVKVQSCPWNLKKIKFLPVKTQSCPWNQKKIKFLPVKDNFLPVKKLKKRQKIAREKQKLPVKKLEKRPKMAFTGNFFFHGGKKKRCSYIHVLYKKMSWQISCGFKNLDKLGSWPNDFQNHPLGDDFFKNGS